MAAPSALNDRIRDFDLLNAHAQETLRARVADADGDIAHVKQEVQHQLDALDSASAGDTLAPDQQANRAFLVGQIAYLSLLEREQSAASRPERQGLLARLRSAWRPSGTGR